MKNLAVAVACPNCKQLTDSHASVCEHCGVDLAIAAILAESLLSMGDKVSADLPMTPEVLVPRLGEYLIAKGFITDDQIEEALQDRNKDGETILLGQALLNRGYITQETLDKAVTEQIFQLHAALKNSNTHLEQRVQERTAELQNTLNKLNEINQLKYNFVSNVSHEVRTPLAHMIGYIDLISSKSLGPLTSEQVDAVNVLSNAYTRLQDLIDSLLLFSLASQGEMALAAEPFSLQKLVKPVITQFQSKAFGRDIVLELDLADDRPNVRADKEKISWVLMQLMDNGIKFNQKGGKVVVSAYLEDPYVQVMVSDTGIGIQDERLNEIFEEFHQLDSSASRKYGGTGIGLAL
ncbi:MAG: ATP-binding protein, partial [Chloroflexota bacterium]